MVLLRPASFKSQGRVSVKRQAPAPQRHRQATHDPVGQAALHRVKPSGVLTSCFPQVEADAWPRRLGEAII
jgi:hypothetical protein